MAIPSRCRYYVKLEGQRRILRRIILVVDTGINGEYIYLRLARIEIWNPWQCDVTPATIRNCFVKVALLDEIRNFDAEEDMWLAEFYLKEMNWIGQVGHF